MQRAGLLAAALLAASMITGCNGSDEAPEAPLPPSGLSQPAETAAGLGQLALTATPAEALAFLDGVFVGRTLTDRPLVATVAAGRYQLRLTRSGHQDVVQEIELGADERLTLHATLATWTRSVPQSRSPVRWALGTRARGMLTEGDRTVGEGEDRRFEDVYLLEGRAGDRRILSAVLPLSQLELVVRAPGGAPVAVEATEERPAGGVPGRQFVHLTFPADGTYEVGVRTRAPAPTPLPYVIHAARGLEAVSNHHNPRFRRRRWPPRELLTPEQLAAQKALEKEIAEKRAGGDGK